MRDQLDSSPRHILIKGRKYPISPLTIHDFLGPLQDWMDQQFPDPFAIAVRQIESGQYNQTQERYLFQLAMDAATKGQRKIGANAEADAMLQSVAGVMEILYLSISKTDPTFTREAARELHAQLTFADIARVFALTQVDQVISDPKATPGMTPAGTATT